MPRERLTYSKKIQLLKAKEEEFNQYIEHSATIHLASCNLPSINNDEFGYKELDYLIEEQCEIKNKCRVKKNRANLTEEQIKKENAYLRQWRANISEEQRQRRKETRLKWLQNLSEEQLEKKKECKRIRRKELTKIRKESKKRVADISEEQRQRRNENSRRWRARLSEEKLERLKENRRRRAADVTPEIKLLTKEKCKNIIRKSRNQNININTNRDTRRCLKSLLKKMFTMKMNLNAIIEDNCHILKKVLRMFGFNYSLNFSCEGMATLQSINYKIDIDCLNKLVIKWDGWSIYDNLDFSDAIYEELYDYLYNNFLAIKLHKDKCLLHDLDVYRDLESCINVTCSLKKLPTMFNESCGYFTQRYQDGPNLSSPLNVGCPNYIFNWSFVSTQIIFPKFSMTRQNIHDNEFHVFSIKSNSDLYQRENVNLFLKKHLDVVDLFLTDFIAKFLNQLKFFIKTNSDKITLERKTELILAITEFEKDISKCTDTIETNTTYYASLTSYPYVRCIGYHNIGTNLFNNNVILDVCLQQTCYPKISFILEKFNVSYEERNDDIYFIFDDLLLDKFNDCILYKCILCDENLGSYSRSHIIYDHFLKYHGIETDWKCSNCAKLFDTNYLSCHRWRHECD